MYLFTFVSASLYYNENLYIDATELSKTGSIVALKDNKNNS